MIQSFPWNNQDMGAQGRWGFLLLCTLLSACTAGDAGSEAAAADRCESGPTSSAAQGSGLGASAEVRLRDSEPPCRIVLGGPVTEISGTVGGPGFDPVGPLSMDGQGRFFTATHSPGVIAVWDSTGSLDTTVGGEGEGPGEFLAQPTIWVDGRDTIHVRDVNGSWTVLAPDLSVVRRALPATPLTFKPFTTILPSGNAVVAYSADRSRVVRILAADGSLLNSIQVPEVGDEQFPRRVVAPASDTSFWAAPQHVYRLEEWTIDGRRINSLGRDPEWLPERASDEWWGGADAGPPPPVLADMHFDAAARVLWVLFSVPDPDGSEVQDPSTSDLEQADNASDFIIEAIDVVAGRVLASHRADSMEDSILGFLPRGMAYRIREGMLGLMRYEVFPINLVDGAAAR